MSGIYAERERRNPGIRRVQDFWFIHPATQPQPTDGPTWSKGITERRRRRRRHTPLSQSHTDETKRLLKE